MGQSQFTIFWCMGFLTAPLFRAWLEIEGSINQWHAWDYLHPNAMVCRPANQKKA